MVSAHSPSVPPSRPPAHGRPLPLRVGTRGSPLALWQTRFFLKRLSGFGNQDNTLEWPLGLTPLQADGDDQWTITLT